MSTPVRRYEILLPLQFNDGRPVPDSVLAETLLELRIEFGAVSCETQSIRGWWQHQVLLRTIVAGFLSRRPCG